MKTRSRRFDVESQSDEDSVPTEYVGTTMTPEKADQWLRTMGTKAKMNGGHYNPHGLLAAHRYVAEKFACELLLANQGALVVDVGAAPHRTFEHLGETGRYIMPSVVAGDNTRRGRVPPEAVPHVCAHRFEDCTCHDASPRCYLMTHSAYYLNPLVLWSKLSDPNVVDAISVEHVFDDMFGGFYDEATWLFEKEIVTMTVSGNAAPYVHSLPPWQSGWIGPAGESFEVDVLKSMDRVTRVVRIQAVKRTDLLEKTTLKWDEVTVPGHLAGPVQFSEAAKNAVADNAKFTHVTFDVHRVRSFGPILYTDFMFKGESVTLTVPTGMISDIAWFCMNRARDAELLAEVSYTFKSRFGRSRMPVGVAAQTLSAAIAVGMVININNEVDVQYTAQEKFSWVFSVHSTLLKFGKVVVHSWLTIYVVLTVIVFGLILAEVFDKDTNDRLLIGFGGFTCLTLVGWALLLCGSLHRKMTAWKERGWVSRISDPENPSAPLLGHNFAFSRGLTIPGSRFVKPTGQTGSGSVSVGATREKVFEPNRSIVSGIVSDGATPTVLHTTQEAELSAVTNRILAPRSNPDQEALAEYKAVFQKSQTFGKVPRGVDTSYGFFKAWLSKLKSSYPAVYIELMETTWKRAQGVAATAFEASKSFLKIEKSAATVKIDANKATKPRLIQPPSDETKAVLGPVVWQLYERIRDAWDGVKCSVCYCSGRSLAYVGSLVDAYGAKYEGQTVYCWSVDMSTYDATLGLELQKPAVSWYIKLGVPAWMEGWFFRTRSRGRTPNGVTYMPTRIYYFADEKAAKELVEIYRKHKLIIVHDASENKYATSEEDKWYCEVEDLQMTSGRPDTNLTDTVCLVAALETALKSFTDMMLLACGDDGALFFLEKDMDRVLAAREKLELLGLKPDGKISARRCDWEFCSKLFWFGEREGKRQTVLGSKPFRGIARMGINTTLPGAANAAQAALSVRVDSGHVPFLAPFADRTYELCKEKKIKATGKAEWTAMRGDKRWNCVPENYVICQERYNLGKENEDEFKDKLRSLTSVPVVFSWLPAVDATAVDEA